MSSNTAIVWTFDSHTEAEASVKEFESRHSDMRRLSILGEDYHTDENVVGFYNVGDRMKVWAGFGAFWGGFWGILFGSAMFVGGLSALAAALYGLGIPKDSILQYETAIKANKFVVVAHGSAPEVAQAKEILAATQITPHATHELRDQPVPTVLVTSGASKGTK